ncbi:MAG: FAD-dependent oxidoreductase [Flavobacteriaceae bacterium]
MELSYWEYKTWLSNVDFTVIGSGIVGLNCAYNLSLKFPKSKIVVLEKGVLPQGASTKNAGFACFGSISELLSDLKGYSEESVVDLVKQRWEGIQLLRNFLGDSTIDFQQNGGHELFLEKNTTLFEDCRENITYLNKLLKPIFGANPFRKGNNVFGFKHINENYITHNFEGQLDTGKMMEALLRKCQEKGIHVLNGISVDTINDLGSKVTLKTSNFEFETKKVCIATNGFASQFLKIEAVKPARAQVLITKPIKDLKIKGTFHFDEGYYYFRNIDNRILFGGGRNIDFTAEQTDKFGQTEIIQNELKKLLKTVILPNHKVEIDYSWSGIMGIGPQKLPIIEQVSNNVFCGVRLGGMGIALGSLIGKQLAGLVN